MKNNYLTWLIILFSTNFIFSQFNYNIETGQSLGGAESELTLGYNIGIVDGDKFSDYTNLKFGYGVTEALDIKLNYQRVFALDANSISVIPKYSFGRFSVTTGIGSFFTSDFSELFLNSMIAYDHITEVASGTFGFGYNTFFNDFGEGSFGIYSSAQRNFDAFGIKLFFHATLEDPLLNVLGLELSYSFGNSSGSSNKKSKKSISDYF